VSTLLPWSRLLSPTCLLFKPLYFRFLAKIKDLSYTGEYSAAIYGAKLMIIFQRTAETGIKKRLQEERRGVSEK